MPTEPRLWRCRSKRSPPIRSQCQPGASCCAVSSRSCNQHRSEEHTSELQSPCNLVCRLLLEKKNRNPATGLPHRASVLLILGSAPPPPACSDGPLSSRSLHTQHCGRIFVEGDDRIRIREHL